MDDKGDLSAPLLLERSGLPHRKRVKDQSFPLVRLRPESVRDPAKTVVFERLQRGAIIRMRRRHEEIRLNPVFLQNPLPLRNHFLLLFVGETGKFRLVV